MRLIIVALCICSFWPANGQSKSDFVKKSHGIRSNAISNKDWMDFIKFIKNDPNFTKSYTLSMLPDEWSVFMINHENKNSAVSKVSWLQAIEYCKWKSELSTYLNTHKSLSDYQTMKSKNERANILISYRLPSEEEFINFTRETKGSIGFRCIRTVYKMNKHQKIY